MGTTLTGTKPKDTYDSLIKVEDNGPISGTAKYLSDGLGNNLPIAVSTSNVGIGTSSPSAKLTISTGSAGVMASFTDAVAQTLTILTGSGFSAINNPSGGDVAIQTSNVERVRVTPNGLTFNGDTAAANALDDYEEGTWTPVFAQGATNNTATYAYQTGTYTKVGNLVTAFFDVEASSITAGSGACSLKGLPFTVGSSMAGYSCVNTRAMGVFNGSLTNALATGFVEKSNTYIALQQVSTTTGQETSISTYASSGRATGVVQYTV